MADNFSKQALKVLVDQNVPYAVVPWLNKVRPCWEVWHTITLGFSNQPDSFLFQWAQERKAMVVTFDEDFADSRSYPLGHHHGIIRLRIWPTTVEETVKALGRLLESVRDEELMRSLVIIDNQKIRIRHAC